MAKNSSLINTNLLVKKTQAQYITIGITGVSNKETVKQYDKRNILRLGNNVKETLLIEEFREVIDVNPFKLVRDHTTSGINQTFNQMASHFGSAKRFTDLIFSRKSGNNDMIAQQINLSTGVSEMIPSADTDSSLKNDSLLSTGGYLKGKYSRNKFMSIGSDFSLACTDSTHNSKLSTHSAGGRKIKDACYFKDAYILSIGFDRTLALTAQDQGSGESASDIDISGINDVIKVESSETTIVVLTSTGTLYLLDTSGNKVEIFADKTIEDFSVSTRIVGIVTEDQELYAYDITTGITTGSEITINPTPTNVYRFDCEDTWIAILKTSGKLESFSIFAGAPNLPVVVGRSYIARATNTKCYIDVNALNKKLIASYI